MGWGDFSDADGFALAMTAMLALAFLTVSTLLFAIRRNSRRRNDDVERLIDGLTRKKRKEKRPGPPSGKRPAPAPPEKEPWERDGDWWKQ